MSLLIKALEQAAKDRTPQRNEAQSPAVRRTFPSLVSEPLLEPAPAPRSIGSFDEPATGDATSSTPPADRAAASPTAPAFESTQRPSRRATSAGWSDRAADHQRIHAGVPADARKASSSVGDFVRRRPIVMFSAVALLCGIGFGTYVHHQLEKTGTFVQPVIPPVSQASSEPAPTAPGTEAASAPTEPTSTDATALTQSTPAPQVPPAHAVARERSTGAARRIDQSTVTPSYKSDAAAAGEGHPVRKPIPSSAIVAAGEPETAEAHTPAESLPERAVSRKSVAPRPEPTPQPMGKAGARDELAISPATNQSRINAHVSEGYALLQTGHLTAARAAYSRAIEAEPLDTDALLGLAYIASRESRSDEAVRTYLRILQLNPRHAIAQAALIAVMGRADPAASETRLKQLLSREPAPFLHFVLGNLYGDQSLWSQAQQSYFQAHHLEPDNPEYAYNLAVALDHLRQSKLALEFYRRAEQLAALKGRASFDVSHARARIGSISSELR